MRIAAVAFGHVFTGPSVLTRKMSRNNSDSKSPIANDLQKPSVLHVHPILRPGGGAELKCSAFPPLIVLGLELATAS